MDTIIVYRDVRGDVTRKMMITWLKILAELGDKFYVNDKTSWVKADLMVEEDSLPFTFFKKSKDKFEFILAYLRLESPSVNLVDCIDFLLYEGNAEGEKHVIREGDREVQSFDAAPDYHVHEEPEIFSLRIKKETLMGEVLLLLEKLTQKNQVHKTDHLFKIIGEINAISKMLRDS
ncbi:hypothetical protein [Peribacillus kribbensis]|uniref:hypothetical protein n=1 Tax=Peribacillus kribbensis TaxID=356658 RepID=UPI00041870F1|nr:hypothetical protein [Peribacillus kribbensis]